MAVCLIFRFPKQYRVCPMATRLVRATVWPMSWRSTGRCCHLKGVSTVDMLWSQGWSENRQVMTGQKKKLLSAIPKEIIQMHCGQLMETLYHGADLLSQMPISCGRRRRTIKAVVYVQETATLRLLSAIPKDVFKNFPTISNIMSLLSSGPNRDRGRHASMEDLEY